MMARNVKVHPGDVLSSEEFHQTVEEAAIQSRNKPYRARSVDYSSPSTKNRNGSMSSFLSQGSNSPSQTVETLINFLTTNMDLITTDKEYMHKFEELTSEVLFDSHDNELSRLIKSYGWMGTRYKPSEDAQFDAHTLLQALSNLYLKNKVSNYTAHISNMFGMGNEHGADQILSFCPDLLLTCLRENSPSTSDFSGVRSVHFKGACMLADISGFSKFSGAMCLKGVSGLDDLREATNGFLGALVKTIYEFHGDVIAFAGDALICVFIDSYGDSESAGKTSDQSGCYRAIQCACILRNHKTKNLSAHIGVSYGDMKIAFLGGLHDQWVYLLNGACVSELAGCINDALSQQVCVTQACMEQAMHYAVTTSISNGNSSHLSLSPPTGSPMGSPGKGVVTDSGDDQPFVPITSKPIAGSDNLLIVDIFDAKTAGSKAAKHRKMSMMMRKQASRTIVSEGPPDAHKTLIESAALFVPRPVLAAVYSESLEHIGELRQVTTIFLSLDSYDAHTHQDPATLQPFFVMTQQVLFEAGGFLRQFLVDDKGCVFIAMWGMPSFTYANNCSRALFFAASVRVKVAHLDHKVSIGITTGNVFCGNVGAPERRDYAGIGNEVNLAARLMGKAKGRILLDKATFNNLPSTTQALLTPAESMTLKGMDQPVSPYAFESKEIPRIAAVDENQGYSTILRKQVKAILSAQMDKVANDDTISASAEKRAHFTVILGMPGTGKTTAADYFRSGMRKRNVPCVLIQARPGHEGVPYGVMRELFVELVGEENFQGESQQREKITYLVEQAYPESEEEEKTKARLILEMVLGSEWSDSFRVTSGSGSADDHDSPSINGRKTITAGGVGSRSGSPSSSMQHRKSDPGSLRKNVLTNNVQELSTHSVSESSRDSFLEELSHQVVINRPEGDLTFYRVLSVLLKNSRTAIIIEDAHFCDELSWNELHLLLIGTNLNISVLLTMRSNSNAKGISAEIGGNTSGDATPSGERRTGARKSVLISQSEAAQAVSSHQASTREAEPDTASKYGLKLQTSAAFLSILGHEHSTVVEMSSLNELEVKDILMTTLKVTKIDPDMVRLVLDVSSGNAFWCKAIASFIKERGVQALEKAAEDGSRINSLKQLILLRMEKLDVDQQLVLKHASIIGDEFSEKMLEAVLPKHIRHKLSESTELLVEHGFVLCIQESPQLIFGFQNDLIRETVYELTPPRDAAHIHLAVAVFIEEEYSKNLRPFYPILLHHYQKSHGKRLLAFKYAVKAADQAISRGAFGDGLRFAQIAAPFALSKAELRVLLLVITRALHDLGPTMGLNQMKKGGNRGGSFSGPSSSKDGSKQSSPVNQMSSRASAYLQLKISTENALEKLSKGASVKPEEAQTGNKNRLVINKQPSARLNWQPSYVASKMKDDSNSDSSDSESEKPVKKAWCSVS